MYVTVAEADVYFALSLTASTWAALTESQKGQALTAATRKIDAQRLVSKKKDPDQTLEFPRAIDEALPLRVKVACCEEAMALLQLAESPAAKGIKSISAGDASETYSDQFLGQVQGYSLSPVARKLLQGYIKRTAPIC